jgi:tripartite ATP-independent transporter DctM subunit
MVSVAVLVIFLVLVFLRMPVSISMGVACLVALLLGDYPISLIPRYMSGGVESFPLMAVPFFIFAGNLMNSSGITTRIFRFASQAVGHFPGGLAQVNVVASMIFAGISGAALADAAGLGTIEIKAMNEHGYRRPFSAAVTLASSCIGPIIPPSIVMIIYAMIAQVSVARLFLAGVVPGVFIGVVLMSMIYYLAVTGKEKCPVLPRPGLKSLLIAFKDGFFALIAPLIILWGMVSGFVTPTEAGVIAVFYSILLGLFYRELTWDNFNVALRMSVVSTCIVMYIIATATVMGWVLTAERVTHMIGAMLGNITTNRYLSLFLINLFLLVVGCILETLPALLITTPILLPVVVNLGIDPVHFGVILCFNLIVGIITPPMGIGLYVMVAVSRLRVEELVKASLPFLLPLLFALAVITFIPQLSLWLPNFLLGPP